MGIINKYMFSFEFISLGVFLIYLIAIFLNGFLRGGSNSYYFVHYAILKKDGGMIYNSVFTKSIGSKVFSYSTVMDRLKKSHKSEGILIINYKKILKEEYLANGNKK